MRVLELFERNITRHIDTYTAKNIGISTDILWLVFILTEPVPYTFVSVNRRNNEARTHTAMWASASLFRRFKPAFHDTDIDTDTDILAKK